jgi:hypothetical protein
MKTRRLASAEQPGFGQAKAQVTALGAQPAKTAARPYIPWVVSAVAKIDVGDGPAAAMDHLSGNHFEGSVSIGTILSG